MRTIIAQFEDSTHAHEAIRQLLERNYDRADIGFIANDVASDAGVGAGSPTAGAGGASLGLLLGLGSFMIPGIGPLLAAGPLAVGLAGAAAGVAEKDAQWLSRSLGAENVSDFDAQAYIETIRSGGALIVMGARDEVADNIIDVLRTGGAVAVNTHARDPNASGA